ncbi:MAG TPA: hypothetical protein VG838_11965 [Opitutaceae bacterium]|nr:hypothetical protein [Opitutaceae bacterium]
MTESNGPTPGASSPGWRSHLPWLWALIPAVFGLCFCEALYLVASDRDLWGEWGRWRWSTFWPFFNDLAVTMEHFKAADLGMDPLGDPQSSYAYPRAFLLLRLLRIQYLPSPVVGAVQAGIWMAAVGFLLRPRSFFRALLTTAIFIAPPFVLGLEEGNVDMLFFPAMLIAAIGWSRSGTGSAGIWPIALLLCAAFLKMYPVFALAGGAWAVRDRRRLYCVAAMIIVGAYWATHAEEIRLVMSKFDLGNGESWGCLLIFSRTFLYNVPHLWLLAVAAYACGFLVAVALGAWCATAFKDCVVPRQEWACYWCGAAICAGCFLTTNYDYRWVHALLTVPLLLRLVGAKRVLPTAWAGLTLLALAVSLAFPLNLHPLHRAFMIVQWANWAFVLLLVFGFMAVRRHSPSAGSAGAALRGP